MLIDSSNSSATFQFAEVIQRYRLGTLVGEPTGGSKRGINGGAFFFLRLPESKVEMDLPIIGYFPYAQQQDQGVIPDVEVDVTEDDVVTGKDAAMAEVTKELALTRSRERLP